MKSLIIVCVVLLWSCPAFSQSKVKDDLRKKAGEVAAGLHVLPPDLRSPVAINAATVWSSDMTQLAIILKAEVLESWHIYAHVPNDQPYIQSELKLKLPEGFTPLENWELPTPYPYDDGIFIYKGSLVFIRFLSLKKPVESSNIKVGLYYQTCDFRQCLPPELATIDLSTKY